MGGYGHNTTGSGTRTAAYLRATTELSKHLGGTRQQAADIWSINTKSRKRPGLSAYQLGLTEPATRLN